MARYRAKPALASQINRYLRHMEAVTPGVCDALKARDAKMLAEALNIEKVPPRQLRSCMASSIPQQPKPLI